MYPSFKKLLTVFLEFLSNFWNDEQVRASGDTDDHYGFMVFI